MTGPAPALTDDAILSLWEEGQDLAVPALGLLLWAAADPEATAQALLGAPVGRRNEVLLRLRAATFGASADCFTACPGCGEQLEFTVDLSRFAGDEDETRGHRPQVGADGTAQVDVDGWRIEFRLPGTADLFAVADDADPWAALLRRCLLTCEPPAGVRSLDPPPDGVVTAVEAAMASADPRAELSVPLACAGCGGTWTAPFDLVSFLWREVDVAARRLLREVDALARSYGWSQAAILDLSPARRAAYLALVSPA